MIWLISLTLAATPVEADFDGDGKKEKVAITGEALVLPGADDVYCTMDTCELSVIDIASDKPGKELLACEHGPRDEVDCSIWRLAGGKWSQLAFPATHTGPDTVTAKGNGVLLAWYIDRWTTRLEKLTVEGSALKVVPQPFYSTFNDRDTDGFVFTPDRMFDIVDAPGGTTVVAKVATGNPVTLLLELPAADRSIQWDESTRWFLIRLQSGLTGWATLQTVIGASDQLTLMSQAG
jgi:hypothetical protein